MKIFKNIIVLFVSLTLLFSIFVNLNQLKIDQQYVQELECRELQIPNIIFTKSSGSTSNPAKPAFLTSPSQCSPSNSRSGSESSSNLQAGNRISPGLPEFPDDDGSNDENDLKIPDPSKIIPDQSRYTDPKYWNSVTKNFKEKQKQTKKERRAERKAKKAKKQERLQEEADKREAEQPEEKLMPINRVYMETPALQRAANKLRADSDSLRSTEEAIKQYRKGNTSVGKGIKPTKTVKGVSHIPIGDKGRIYFRVKDGVMEIVGFSGKDDQKLVIRILRQIYGKR